MAMRRARRLASHPASTPIIVQVIHGQPLIMHNWLLPEYIEDMLPAQALRFERVRRQ